MELPGTDQKHSPRLLSPPRRGPVKSQAVAWPGPLRPTVIVTLTRTLKYGIDRGGGWEGDGTWVLGGDRCESRDLSTRE